MAGTDQCYMHLMYLSNGNIGDDFNLAVWCLGSTVMLVPPAAECKKPGVMGKVYDKWLGVVQLHNISSNLILAKCS